MLRKRRYRICGKGGGKHCYGQSHYGVNKSMIHFTKKNEDKIRASIKASAPLNAQISCIHHCALSTKLCKGHCTCGWTYIRVRIVISS
jgi:hypothetical protein